MKKNWGIFVKRILVTALTLALIGGSVDLSGFTVSAQTAQEEAAPGKAAQGESAQEKTAQGEAAQEKQTTVTVTGFAELPENIREQQLPVGAQESDIYLPESLTVTVEKTVMEDKGETDEEQSGTKGDSASQKEGGAAEGTGSGEQGESEGSTGSEGQGAAGDTGSGEQGGTEGSAGSEGQGAAGGTGSGEQGESEGGTGPEGQGMTEEAGNAAGEQGTAGQDNAAPENGNNSSDNVQAAGVQDGSGEGLVGRIADWLFAPMMVYAAENPAGEAAKADTEETTGNGDTSRTTEEVSLTGITWELDKEESDAEEFDASEAADGFCYVYTPVLPDTDKDGNTLAVGDDVELPAIYVLVGEPQLALLNEGAVAEVTVGNKSTTYPTVNAAIDAIQTAINKNESEDMLDINLTFLADQTVTDLNCTLDGTGKTNLIISMNGKMIKWDNNASPKDFSLSMKNINTTLRGGGKLSATVYIGKNADLTVTGESIFEYQGTLTIKDGGTANLKNWDGNGSAQGNIVIESGSCTITGGTYGQIDVEFGAKLEVSGDTAKIASLNAYSPGEDSTVKRAEIKLSGGTYNTISYPYDINQSYLEESTYHCAIVDMLASGYRFYDSEDNKTEKTPVRAAKELTNVKVLTEPEVIVSFQITKTDGTTQRNDFSTWNEAMSYLSDSGNETEFVDWKKVEILLKKDASISESVDPISDSLSAELVLRSEGDTIHTLSGTSSFSSLTALHINGQKLTVEKINLSNAYVRVVYGTVTIKNKADLKAKGGAIEVERSTLILENGASVSSMDLDYKSQIAIRMTDTAILRIKEGAMITGEVSDGGNQNGGIVVIEEGATLPSVAFWENSKVRVYCNLDSTEPGAWADMKGGSVYFPIDCNGVTLTDKAINECDGKIYGRYKTDGSSKIQVPDTVCSYQSANGTITSGAGGTFTMLTVNGKITPVDADHTFTMPPAKVKLLKHTPDDSGSCPYCGKTDLAKAYADGKLQINGLTGRTYDSWPQVMTGITLKGADGSTKTLNGPKYNVGRELAQDSTDAANADLADADYAVVYENNIKAYDKKEDASGFDAAKAPKVTIIGQGAYTGTIEYYFTIGQGKLQMAGFEARQSQYIGSQDALQKYGTLTYEADETDAAAHVPKAGLSDTSIPACTGKTVSADGFDSVAALKLEYSADEGSTWKEIRQSSQDTSKASYQITNAGTYPFWIRATDENVSAPATQSLTATIEKRNMREVSVTFIWPDAWESDQPDSVMKRIFYFTGKPIVPDVGLVVRDYIGEHCIVLKKDEDYKIYATDNISDGQATLYVEGIGNYEGMRQKLFTIGFAFSLEQTSASSGHWYNKDVPAVFGVNDTTGTSEEALRQILYRRDKKTTEVGDNIKLYPTLEDAMNGTNEGYTYTKEGKNNAVLYGKDTATGYISRTNPVWIWIDKTAPTWADKNGNTDGYGIEVKKNWWRTLLNTISFGMLCNDDTLDIKIHANDKKKGLQDGSVSGIDKYYYYVDTVTDPADKTTAKTKAELDALAAQGGFTEAAPSSGVFNGEGATISYKLPSDGKYVVYAYAVDKAGNKSDYICTEGLVRDTTAPGLTVTAPKQEEGTLQDTTATITVQTDEDATLVYCFVYDGMVTGMSCEEAAAKVESYMDSEAKKGTRLPLAKQENGKWIPDYIGGFATKFLDGVYVRYYQQELKAGENTFTLEDVLPSKQTKVWLAAMDKAGNITDTKTLEFTTTQAMPKITTLPQLSGVYGDTVDKLTLTDGVAEYGDNLVNGTWSVESTDSEKPEVGTTRQYTVKFTPTGYNGGFADVYVKVTPTIAKRPINIRVADMTKGYQDSVPELTFEIPTTADGKTQLADGDTKEMIQSSLHLVTEATAESDAGAYPFTVTSDSSNYEVTATYVEDLGEQTKPSKTQGTLTITKAQGELVTGTDYQADRKVTFGDAAFSLGVTPNHTESKIQYQVTDEKILSVSADGMVTIKGAGSAKIQISLPESTNYNAAATKTITVNVEKKSGYAVSDINKSHYYARDNADTIDLALYLPSDCGAVTYGTPQTGGTVEYTVSPAVADGTLTYTVKQADSAGAAGTIKVTVTTENYADFTITVNVKLIDKLPVSLQDGSSVTLQNSTLTYGEALSKLVFNSAVFVDDDGNVVTGTLAWKTPDATPDAGTTSAGWLFTPDDEAYATVEDSVAITVRKATPVVNAVPIVAERDYDPNTALTDADLTDGSVTGVDGKALAGAWSFIGTNVVPAVNNTGYQAVFTPTDTTNYETVTRTITVSVTKATPYIAENPIASAITYGQTLADSALTGGKAAYKDAGGTEIAGSFAWKNGSLKPAVSDSGVTEYEVTFTPSDTTNYNTVEVKLTLTVNKAALAPNMPGSEMKPAHSTAKVGDVTLPKGWSWSDADKDKELSDGVDVTATAIYTDTDQGNYETESVSITITRSTCEHKKTTIRNREAATCIWEGYTGDTYCRDCGELLTAGKATAKRAHTVETPATCVSEAVCSVCMEVFGGVDAANHVHTTVKNRKDATCTQTGYTGDTYCADCSKLLLTGKETAALGHDYQISIMKQPTTTEEGIRTYSCSRCSSSYTEGIAKLPEEKHTHNYTGSITKTATCTDTGQKTFTCSCGDSYTETIPATGHSYTSVVTKAATTTEEGIMTYLCGNCEHRFTQPIAKLASEDGSEGDGSEGDGNTNPGQDSSATDTGAKPYIKDDRGKEGWEAIRLQFAEAKSGETVTVVMNGTTIVPKDVFDSVKGKNVTLALDMGNGVTWKIKEKDIRDAAGDIDFGITIGTDAGKTIPVDVIKNVTGERYSMNLTLAYDGEFGFTATLTINMESENAGLYANLFYYNEQTGKLEFVSAGQIGADGNVELTFTHASDYTIVIDQQSMNDDNNKPADGKADETIPASKTDDTMPKYAWNNTILIMIGIGIILIVFGAVFYVRKKRGSKE